MTAQAEVFFISHSSKDRAFVRAFAAQLGAAGLDTWVDVEDIIDGAQWVRVIQKGVEDCQALIVVWSANARASAWVERETLMALRLNKPVFIVIIDDTPLPIHLIDRQASDLREPGDANIERLVRALKKTRHEATDPTPSPDVGKPSEHNFFKYLEQLAGGEESARVARALFEFARRQTDAVTFSGKTEPAFHAHLWLGPGGVSVFSVRTRRSVPTVEVPLQYWQTFPPYDAEVERRAVLSALNSLMPAREQFPQDRANLRPNLPLGRVLREEDAVERFEKIMKEVIQRLRAGQ